MGPDRAGLRPELHRRGLRQRVLPERQPQRARDRRVHEGGRARRGLADPRGQRRPAGRHVQGARHLPQDGRGGPPVRRPGHPVRQHDQRLAHQRGLGPDLRIQPVLRIHVPQRHGVQPGQPQPDEVRGRGWRVRRRRVPVRGQGHDHGAGDPGRQRQLSHAEDRGEQPPVPAARPGLRQPRRAAHEPRAGLRLRRGSRVRGRDHRPDARRGLPPERGHRARSRRTVRGLRHQPGLVPAGHRQAPRGGLRAARDRRPAADAGQRPPAVRRGPRAGHAARLPQRAGHRARAHRHHRVHDGLRHHRHRARHRAHQVQEAGRRGLPQDRQPDCAGRPAQARLRRRAG